MHKIEFNRTFLIIMDDFAFNKKFMESENFRKLAFNSRHYHIIFIFSTQSISEVPTDIR
jgi:DNA helicase HerA-like ATPase